MPLFPPGSFRLAGMERFNKKEFFQKSLKHWFEENKRELPWRKTSNPYAVWVSEVMLQQTQASVVIPYYERWMARFPTIRDLAKAPLEEVIKAWEGLGYYSRARNLHQGAKTLVSAYESFLPEEPKELAKIKGLGPYTIGAIQSFAFRKKAAAIDGNVLRVISRFFLIEEDINTQSVQRMIRQVVEEWLPDFEPWVVMEAIIELGALVCTKNPKCEECPLKEECLAFCLGKETALPIRKRRVKVTLLQREVALIYHKKEILVQKQKEKKLMADLYEFPYFEEAKSVESFYKGSLRFYKQLKEVTHTFTRFKATLFPKIWIAKEKKEIEDFEWVGVQTLSKRPFSSGHRRILKQLLEEYADLTY